MKPVRSIVFSPTWVVGGVKSLYTACECLNELGRSSICPFDQPQLASWFSHNCALYDYSYTPDLIVYPEVFQPNIEGNIRHICYALGKYNQVQPHADLVVCRSRGVLNWVAETRPELPLRSIVPGIKRSIFEYDGRAKEDKICYMTRENKFPGMAALLRKAYGSKVVEIQNLTESEVAETLKNARVFVWCGSEHEGSPRPPKEALVAGCIVVGLEKDLCENLHTDFGIKGRNVEEVIALAGKALDMPLPTREERAVVRDSGDEKLIWKELIAELYFTEAQSQPKRSFAIKDIFRFLQNPASTQE